MGKVFFFILLSPCLSTFRCYWVSVLSVYMLFFVFYFDYYLLVVHGVVVLRSYSSSMLLNDMLGIRHQHCVMVVWQAFM